MNSGVRILWADDEIELLKPHVLFLRSKGYDVVTVTNGEDAFDHVLEENFDIVFLDENMPGVSGLETLSRIKAKRPLLPIVMITKSEEESIMEEAIGSQISDYLIKPVNPNQILLSLKKNLDNKRLISENVTSGYQQEFRKIGMRLGDYLDSDEWIDLYKELVYWELRLEESNDAGMQEILAMQKNEANEQFSKFIDQNYLDWVNGVGNDIPQLSHTLIKNWVVPNMSTEEPVFLIVIDNLRYDQWRVIRPYLMDLFVEEDEKVFYSILPTATQYARNALFAGLMPSEIEKKFPKLWKSENDEGSKNAHEGEFLENLLRRLGKDVKSSYHKILSLGAGKKLVDNFHNLYENQFNAIVYNFVDMLSHARTEMEVIRELASDEAAYRSLTESWFTHSPLFEMFQKIAEKGGKVIVTTDHGTVRVKEPCKIIGDRKTNTNLRYKIGKNLNYNEKDVFEVLKPEEAFLPKENVSSTYVFAKNDQFFAYPNNFNYYANYYKDTFQHGGISMEEVLIPFAVLSSKK